MKVCIDLNPYLFQPTGIGLYMKGLFDNLCKIEKKDLSVIGLCSSYKYKLDNNKDYEKGRIVNARIPSKLYNLLVYRYQLPIIELLLLSKVDIVHSAQAIIMPSMKAKKVITVHDLYFYHNGGDLGVGGLKLSRDLVKKSVRRADLIICVSKYTYSKLAELFPGSEKKGVVIYPGFNYKEKEDDNVRDKSKKLIGERFGLVGDYILFVGTIEERKNLVPLVEAVSMMNDRRVRVKLVIAGKIGYKGEEVIDKIKGLEYVEHLGYVSEEEKEALYRNARVLVLPSKEEGFGFPVLEAMQYGVPVVASSGSSLEEVGGDAICLFNRGDAEEMMNVIMKVLMDDNLRQQLINKGYERCKLFDWKETVAKIYDEYLKLFI
jgi:glycosyltransferase involved in cell wall biosynthesis